MRDLHFIPARKLAEKHTGAAGEAQHLLQLRMKKPAGINLRNISILSLPHSHHSML
jgi:hypothetical protein